MERIEDARRAVEALFGEVLRLRAIIEGIDRGKLSHTSGGDPGMIFDADDAAVERQRGGYWTVDEVPMAHLLIYQSERRRQEAPGGADED
jgi:hypothetical protein